MKTKPLGPPTKHNYKPVAPNAATPHKLIADTGATGHFLSTDYIAIDHSNEGVINIQPAAVPINVELPDASQIVSTHTAHLDIPCLPPQATEAHLFPALGPTSLLSIGKLCDAGCETLFRAHECIVMFMGDVILRGTRGIQTNKLWQINLPLQTPTAKQYANATITTPSATPADITRFLHAAFFSPVISTLTQALKLKYITNVPGLTLQSLKEHTPNSIATTKGHMKQKRQGTNSTKTEPAELPLLPDIEIDYQFPKQEPSKTHACYGIVLETTGKTFSDQTGRFILPSSLGSNYIFLLYVYDSNSIHVEPMINRTALSHVKAYTNVYNKLVRRGLKPQLHMLDNECSQLLRDYLASKNITVQTTPAGSHRRNAAERAIQTFKDHFIAGLCTTDPKFPLHLWDRLLEQAEITLNLLRGSRINPNLSAYAQVFGNFDYNATPLAPPGIHTIVYQQPSDRGTWDPHGKDAWYVGPAMDSYRCYRTWVWETQKERKAETLSWFPTHLQMPTTGPLQKAIAGINDIKKALQSPPTNSPLHPLTDSEVATLDNLADIFRNRDATTPVKPEPAPASSTAPVLRVEQEQPSPAQQEDTFIKVTRKKKRGKQKRTAKHKQTRSTTAPYVPPTTRSKTHAANTATTNSHTLELDSKAYKWLVALLQDATPDNMPQPHQANKAINPDTGALADYKELRNSSDGDYWTNSCSDEVGRLAQGRASKGTKGTSTFRFVSRSEIPSDRVVTYLRIVCNDRPEKTEVRRVRWTVGGDRIDYPFDVSTKTAALATVKILLNSVISTQDARFMTLDIKDFYLNTPMDRPEYMRIPIDVIPEEIIEQYNLRSIESNGYVYVEINRSMYGLPQAGRLANDELVPYLKEHGYIQSKRTPGLFTHQTRPIAFSLVVDDFGVKYVGKQHAEHLIAILKDKYTITTDWTGSLYCGISLKWDYNNHTVELSMPGYVLRALQRFEHETPKRQEHAPHEWIPPKYGAPVQYAEPPDHSNPIGKAGIKRIQQIVGVFLYYGRAIDNTILVALGDLGSQQTKSTERTVAAANKLMNYLATHPEATIRYHRSKMILHIHTDGSYLSAPKARSRAGGYHFLSNGDTEDPPLNGAIHVHSSIIRNVMSSAAEAEIGAAYLNAQDACPMRQTLIDLGHTQPTTGTPLQTDNACAEGILNDTVKQKRSKAIDMRFYWLQDRALQGMYNIYWKPGESNHADYFSKHHSPAHHKRTRPVYLYIPKQQEQQQHRK